MGTRPLKTLSKSLAKRLLQQHTPVHHKNGLMRHRHDKEAIMSSI
jgi:hypothetical protein